MRQPRAVSPSEALRADPIEELMALPAELVPDLPVPVTLWLELEGAPARVQLTTRAEAGPSAWARETLADAIVFDREEVRALVIATQADRVWRKDLLGVCFDKWRRPDHRWTLADALAGANPDAHDWTLGRVLERLGATVESLELGEGTPEVQRLSEAA